MGRIPTFEIQEKMLGGIAEAMTGFALGASSWKRMPAFGEKDVDYDG